MAKKPSRAKSPKTGPVQLMITTGDGVIRVRASRLIPPGRRFVSFANALEDAIERALDKGWERQGRAWLIPGPVTLAAFRAFVVAVTVITDANPDIVELLPVQMDDIDDTVVLPAPELGPTKRRSKPIEDSIAQIKGELMGGRILTAKAVAKLGAAYDRRGVELPSEVFERVAAILRKAAAPTSSAE